MRISKVGLIAAGGVWLFVVGAGMKAAMDYESVPGPSRPGLARWPSDSLVAPPRRRPLLVLFAHPRCPCTRATVDELLEIAARVPGKAEIDLWFYQPRGAAADWTHSDLWRRAAAQPGLRLHNDEGGEEARRFGASTSGTVMLYDAHCELVFCGGITALRGKTGDSRGRQAVLSYLLDGKRGPVQQTPVFGCALSDAEPPSPGQGSS